MQLSVAVEVESYGDQAAASNHQFCCKSREEPSRELNDGQHRVVQLARSPNVQVMQWDLGTSLYCYVASSQGVKSSYRTVVLLLELSKSECYYY